MRPIDADALVAKLDDWRGDIEDVDKNDAHDVAYYSAMSRAIRFAKDAPTLDLAPVRHGEWKYLPPTDTLMGAYSCTLCGLIEFVERFNAHNFCPNCGAKMVTEEA